MRPTLRSLVRTHRDFIDDIIRKRLNGESPPAGFNDPVREQWVLNDKILYRWARAEGVKL